MLDEVERSGTRKLQTARAWPRAAQHWVNFFIFQYKKNTDYCYNMYQCKHFKIQELVSKIVYERFGEFCWSFFSDDFKCDLDAIREYHGHEITINNWLFGDGSLQQCGFRSNLDPMVASKTTLYCSAHCMGKAVDMRGRDNIKLWNDCKFLIENSKLLTIKRLESTVSTQNKWVHVDCFETADGKLQVFV